MKKDKLKVSVVIVNYNGKADTLECLQSSTQLSTFSANWQIRLSTIVVDNASSDGSAEKIKRKFPQVLVISNKENLGFVGGNNLGIKKALESGMEFILILNNDTLVPKNLVEELVKVIKKNEKIGIAAPKIYFAPGYEYHKERYKKQEQGKVIWYAGGDVDWQNMFGRHIGVNEVDKGQFNKEKKVDFATGCCFLVKKEVFERIGLFDEKFFLYQEDLDFSVRARKAGYQILYCPKAYLWHKNAGSSGAGSPLHDYYLTRNRLLIGWRYASLKTKLALFRESLKRLFSGRKWEKIGIRDFYLAKFGKGSYEA